MSECVAVVDKKTNRPGGCVGIFFQLFDWNRRFAKKKLFSIHDALAHSHPKQCERKFGSGENLPRLRLIGSENSGGFPNMKKNGKSKKEAKQKSQVRSPSLVARLMGLESMPAVQKKSLEKTLVFQTNMEGDNLTSTQNVFTENGKGKHELRPQKAQKTGPSEKQALNKFTAEVFQFKSVLSRTKKHRPKLVSPVKNPRISSGKTSSRLIDVASKLLEPGLQNTSRAKSAITYLSTTHNNSSNSNNLCMEREMVLPDIPKSSDFHFSTDSSPISACKHCGSQLEKLEITPNLEENAIPFSSFLPNYSNNNIEQLKRSSIGPHLTSFEQEKWRVSERYQELSTPFTAQARNKRKHYSKEPRSLAHWNLTQQSMPRMDPEYSTGLKHKTLRQSQVSMVRDRVPHRLNRASSIANVDRSGTRTPMKVDYITCNEESSSCNRRGGSLSRGGSQSPVRKMRSMNTNNGNESSKFSSSTVVRPRNARCNTVGENEKEIRLDSHSFNSTNRGSTMRRCGHNYKANEIEGINETSPWKQKNENGVTRNKTRESSSSGGSDAKVSAEKLLAVSGDELGAILQEKLKELSCHEEGELSTGGDPKRTTAVVLQELISALTAEKPMLRNDGTVESNEKYPCRSPQLPNNKCIYEDKQKTARTLLRYLPQDELLSPGSVLEASLSTDSCLSSNFGDGPELYNDGPSKLEPGTGIFDHAASLSKGCCNIQSLIYHISHVSEVLLSLGFDNTGLNRSKQAYSKEVILNAELISRTTNQGLSLGHFLVYELENLANAMRTDFGSLLGFEDKKHQNKIKEFVFDCVIEYLDTRYGQYSSCGFIPLTRISPGSIADDVVAEVKSWMAFSDYALDEMIDFEMSHSYGKWTDFEIEEYETGVNISKDVLQILVDEIVVELSEGKICSKRI